MPKQLPSSSDFQKLPTEAEQEEQLMQDVLLLLEHMIYREEITVKLILNCLYDAGATNLINQKFRSPTFNKTLKSMAKMSKPVFRMIAWQWFRKNCPQLIADWLREKIEFKNLQKPQVEIVVEHEDANLNPLSQNQNQIYEVKQLRSQVKLLTGIFVGVITVLTGSFLWTGYLLDRSHSQVVKELQTQVKTLKAITGDR